MRRLTPILALGAVLVLAACARPSGPQAVHQSHTFPAAAGKLIRLDVRSLDVHVKVAEGSVISVTVDLQARSSSRSATKRWIERNTPVFDDSESVLEVRLPAATHRGLVIFGFMHTEGRLDLVVPPSCRLDVKTSSGDVSIGGEGVLSGPVRVGTSSGDVIVSGGVRELIADTSSGDVRVTGVALTLLEADTSSGDVTLQSGSEKVIVDTTSGDARLEKLTGDLSADTSSGDVSGSWERLAAGGKIRVHTSSGDVRLGLPEGTPLGGEVNTTGGHIRSDFPASREKRGRMMSFEAPGDSVGLEVRTSSGDVSLRTRS
ncbi:MAG: DUF4097 domain-containing protein [Thermoanaerobaculaceae bacterium]|nr:DUF4097 domain-containing protein [Thermoanaerobaculaceae bacterium]